MAEPERSNGTSLSEKQEAAWELIDVTREAWTEELRSNHPQNRKPREHVWASGFRDCHRQMALDCLHPEDEGEFSPDAMEQMTRGKEREAALDIRLRKAGPRSTPPFEVIHGQQWFEVKDRDGLKLITGKLDGRIRFQTDAYPREMRTPVLEAKSGASWWGVETLEDMDRNRWSRHTVDQMLSYLYAEGEPWGILWLEQRYGLPTMLPVILEEEDHLERAERNLETARAVVLAAKGKAELPPMIDDPLECKVCPHLGKTCHPNLEWGPGAHLETDPEAIRLAQLIAQGDEIRKDVNRARDWFKKRYRGVEVGIFGSVVMRGKYRKQSTLKLPKDLRAEYTVTFQPGEEGSAFLMDFEEVPD